MTIRLGRRHEAFDIAAGRGAFFADVPYAEVDVVDACEAIRCGHLAEDLWERGDVLLRSRSRLTIGGSTLHSHRYHSWAYWFWLLVGVKVTQISHQLW
jgi:hypothetical protein